MSTSSNCSNESDGLASNYIGPESPPVNDTSSAGAGGRGHLGSPSRLNRFADYFAICGLDLDTGLEPDRFSGEYIDYRPRIVQNAYCLSVLYGILSKSNLKCVF